MAEYSFILFPLLVILLQISESDQVQPSLNRCDQTTWTRSHQKVELVTSEEVSPTGNSSLRVKDVGTQHAGQYKCKLYEPLGQDPQASLVFLSVISLREVKDHLGMELNCSVSTNLRCNKVPVRWLIEGLPAKQKYNRMKVRTGNCWTSAYVPTSVYGNILTRQNFTCEVKCDHKMQQFSFRTQGPEGITIKYPISTEKEVSKTSKDMQNQGWWWAVVAVSVASVVTAVLFITWRRVRVKPEEPISSLPREEGVSYASINFKKRHKKIGVRACEEAVTYSSVRIQTSENPAQLDASSTHDIIAHVV